MSPRDVWPELPYAAWKETCLTLQLWTQIVGKIRLVQTPWLNHSWHVVLYVSARGLTTSPIPYGDRSFELDFDFLDHELKVSTSDGRQARVALSPRSVADFYADLMRTLSSLGIDVRINELPNEIPDAIRFSEDRLHASYDREYAQRFWRILVQATRVFGRFRTSGKLRSRGDAVLGTPRPSVSRRHRRAEHARGRCARRLFARVQQRGVLARGPRRRLCRLLLLCLALAARVRERAGPSGGSLLEP
jgi:hypothetical protein